MPVSAPVIKTTGEPIADYPFDLPLMQLRHDVNVSQSAFEISSNHLLRLRPPLAVALMKHTLLILMPMPYRHGLKIGITTPPFRHGRRGNKSDGATKGRNITIFARSADPTS
jgi:hypothetical protein